MQNDLSPPKSHPHTHPHTHPDTQAVTSQSVKDLKSPVLFGVVQRVLCVSALIAALWFFVLWALQTHA